MWMAWLIISSPRRSRMYPTSAILEPNSGKPEFGCGERVPSELASEAGEGASMDAPHPTSSRAGASLRSLRKLGCALGSRPLPAERGEVGNAGCDRVKK